MSIKREKTTDRNNNQWRIDTMYNLLQFQISIAQNSHTFENVYFYYHFIFKIGYTRQKVL